MNYSGKTILKRVKLVIPMLLLTLALSAQTNEAYENAKKGNYPDFWNFSYNV